MNPTDDPELSQLEAEWARVRDHGGHVSARDRRNTDALLAVARRGPGEERFSAFIRVRRMSLGLTQQELAERIGVHETLISQYERLRAGQRLPQPEALTRLATALETTPGHLLRLRGYDLSGEPLFEASDPIVSIVTSFMRDTDWENVPEREREMIKQMFRMVHDGSHQRNMRDGVNG